MKQNFEELGNKDKSKINIESSEDLNNEKYKSPGNNLKCCHRKKEFRKTILLGIHDKRINIGKERIL